MTAPSGSGAGVPAGPVPAHQAGRCRCNAAPTRLERHSRPG